VCWAQGDTQTAEYQVKAAFLYKFASYVDWPPAALPRPDSPLVIGVAGADALADELERAVAGRNVNGHPMTVRKLRRGDALTGVHILFVGRAEGGRAAEILAAARGQPVLTVTESEDAFTSGAAINFVVVDDKVRFDVAVHPAQLGNLRISSRLLAVARRVITSPS